MKALLTLALVASLQIAACKKQEGPTCSDVSAHVIDLVRNELAKQKSSQDLISAQANLPTLKDALTNVCQEKKWSKGTRQCVLDARTAAETEACDPGLETPLPTGDSN